MKRFLAALLLAAPLAANAFQFTVGAGVTNYETVDGRWFQQSQPHSLSTRPKAWSVGVMGDVTSYLAWHAEYVDLGRASVSCDCLTRDEDYAAHRAGPQAQFAGHGATQGFVLSLEPHTTLAGWRLAAETGVYLGHTRWSETVTGWTVNEAAPQNLGLSSSRWQASPVAGVSVGRANWSVRYRHYFMSVGASKDMPPVWRDADVLEYVMRF